MIYNFLVNKKWQQQIVQVMFQNYNTQGDMDKETDTEQLRLHTVVMMR